MKQYFIISLLFLTSWAYANQAKDVIPFEIVNGHIQVEITINNSRPLNFVFDTGAAANLLSDRTAHELGLNPNGNTSIQGAGGSAQMKLVEGADFNFNKTSFENETFAVLNIDHLSEDENRYDGILGASVLSKYVVEIDYDKNAIRLYDSLEELELSEYAQHKYSLTPFNIPIIESTLTMKGGEQIKGKYFVDTGAALAIVFNSNLVEEYDLLNTMGDNYPITSTALSSQYTDHVSVAPKFTMLGHTFEGFDVRLSQAKQGVNSFEGYHGIIGYELLRRFNSIFDYKNERVYIRPNQSYDEVFPKNYSGLQVEREGENYRVINVAQNSAADEVKIQKGDLITQLDGKKLESKSEFSDYFQYAEKDVRLEIIRKGKTIKALLSPRPTIN